MNEMFAQTYVVDDDLSVREALEGLIRSAGMKVQSFGSAREFLAGQRAEVPSCLVLDVDLPGLSGLDLQQELAKANIHIPIIFLTGHGDIPMSVRAIKAGAIEFLTKPFDDQHLLDVIRRGIAWDREMRGEANPAQWKAGGKFGEMVGQSGVLQKITRQIEIVAPTETPVLILGETGTGKELVAREIHARSRRKDNPLVRVNCASIPRELYESEFFGHVRGAFTGAVKDRAGRFETAAGGTLFLDEIGEIPLELQCKLLRVLQDKLYERVGEDKTRHANVRVIAATNRNLEKEVAAGRFREDLYYRLNVFPMAVAPLRERKEDIPLLASHFLKLALKESGCAKPRLTPAGIEMLRNYDWPGNIRELRNVIERAVILAQGGVLSFDLPTADFKTSPSTSLTNEDKTEPEYFTEPEMQRRERENLFVVLQKTNWKIKGIDGAAELLGVKPTTLISRIEKMGLKRPVKSMETVIA